MRSAPCRNPTLRQGIGGKCRYRGPTGGGSLRQFGCGVPSLCAWRREGDGGGAYAAVPPPSPAHTSGLSAFHHCPLRRVTLDQVHAFVGQILMRRATPTFVLPVEAKRTSPRTKSTACNILFSSKLRNLPITSDPMQAQRPSLLTHNNPFRLQIELNRFCPPTCLCSAWKQVLR